MLNGIILNDNILNVTLLNEIMLIVIMPNVILQSAVSVECCCAGTGGNGTKRYFFVADALYE